MIARPLADLSVQTPNLCSRSRCLERAGGGVASPFRVVAIALGRRGVTGVQDMRRKATQNNAAGVLVWSAR